MVAKTRSASQGGTNKTPQIKNTSAIKKRRKAKSASAQSPTLTQQFSMAEYCSTYGIKPSQKRNADALDKDDRLKVARTVQISHQSVSGNGNNNITISAQNKQVIDSDSDSDSDGKEKGKNATKLHPEIETIVGDDNTDDKQTKILNLLIKNSTDTLKTRHDVGKMKAKIRENTQSITNVQVEVATLSSRVETLEQTGPQKTALDTTILLEDVMKWTNTMRNGMTRALGQVRVVGFAPNSRAHAEDIARNFLEKLFQFKTGRQPPEICKFMGMEKQGTKDWGIIIGVDPNLANTMITWNSELNQLWPLQSNRNKSYVYINPEMCPQLRTPNRKYILIGRDLRAVLGGYTKIKPKPDSLSLHLCYKQTKNEDFRSMYSFTPRHGVEIAATPICYLPNPARYPDPIVTAVLFRKSRAGKNPLSKDWIEDKLVEINADFRNQLPNLLTPIRAKDTFLIGYKINTGSFKEGEELFVKLIEPARSQGIEVTHFGKSSDDKDKDKAQE